MLSETRCFTENASPPRQRSTRDSSYRTRRRRSLQQISGDIKDLVEHFLGEPTGESVLLAGMIGGKQSRAIPQHGNRAVAEGGSGAGRRPTQARGEPQQVGMGKPAQSHHHLHPLQTTQFLYQPVTSSWQSPPKGGGFGEGRTAPRPSPSNPGASVRHLSPPSEPDWRNPLYEAPGRASRRIGHL